MIQDKLAAMNLTLPAAPKPVASYVPFVRTGSLVLVSGQLPMREGKLICEGIVPCDVTVEAAQQAMVQCALNALAIVGDAIEGDWDRLVRVVRLGAFVACDRSFTQHPQVANGASDLMLALFGEAGRHARAAVGAISLPLNAPVELEAMFEVKG